MISLIKFKQDLTDMLLISLFKSRTAESRKESYLFFVVFFSFKKYPFCMDVIMRLISFGLFPDVISLLKGDIKQDA